MHILAKLRHMIDSNSHSKALQHYNTTMSQSELCDKGHQQWLSECTKWLSNSISIDISPFYGFLFLGALSLSTLLHSFYWISILHTSATCMHPCILSRIGEILISSLDHLLSAPCSLVLLVVITLGDFSIILFLISMCIFLISGALLKTQTNAHLIDFGLSEQYQNLIQCTLLANRCTLSWVCAKLEWARTTFFAHARD